MNRRSVDAWIETFLRNSEIMRNGTSRMGIQLDSLQRLSVDSEGRPVKRRIDPEIREIPCRDDSAAFNASHRADGRLADHAADVIVWSRLSELQRALLIDQRLPLTCPGSYENSREELETDPGYDKNATEHLRRCPRCMRPVTGAMIGEHNRINLHSWFVAIEKVRLTAERRHGDGSTLVGHEKEDGRLTGYSTTIDWQPITLTHAELADRHGITMRQVRTEMQEARKTIAEALEDES